MFQAKISGKFAALCILLSDVDTIVDSLKKKTILNSHRSLLETEEEDSAFGHKGGCGETRAETTEMNNH